MTTHLFQGHMDGDTIVVTSGITLCCGIHTIGLPKGDTGTVLRGGSDCYRPSDPEGFRFLSGSEPDDAGDSRG